MKQWLGIFWSIFLFGVLITVLAGLVFLGISRGLYDFSIILVVVSTIPSFLMCRYLLSLSLFLEEALSAEEEHSHEL